MAAFFQVEPVWLVCPVPLVGSGVFFCCWNDGNNGNYERNGNDGFCERGGRLIFIISPLSEKIGISAH